MYLRFTLPKNHPNTGVSDGVFKVAYELRRGDDLSEQEFEELGDLLHWFGENLKVPTRFNRTKSKGHYRRATKGISWFKSAAGQHVTKIYRMAAILR